ncbi:hypothetical protein A3C37_04410 [Candidatus Peribacteria bacterium RIFCSPHIGHO2_02_FULL_53_20]|nr:MAG: hypothetical protein A3C37_04410 [Candidatus Peribacteria bacterium RIFCSPHIGHO2_02_FULL_53_20]OGJ67503.1 MAG: hypothetical protein A3B61_00115 [Candidatus Peribacteria bacterium RIFCSPLOWO2_01_FULL_53_10]OGJ69816.1 MAG: hypothetical protein A3G69_05795 [Candidatus Peribacteria bacterium RIFCSPLOWO2_12_FULL_53_10]
MRLFSRFRRSSRFIVGGGTLLLAMSLYGSGAQTSSLLGRVSSDQKTTERSTLHNVREFGTAVRARKEWKSMRANIRTATADAPHTGTARNGTTEILLRSAQLSPQHLELSYSLPNSGCVSLWVTGAANQKFQRVTVIGGIPCSTATGEVSARLLLTSVHPALAEGQLAKLCANSTLQCTEPIAITGKNPAVSHSAAGALITIHFASIVRNSMLSITYSKTAGCGDLVRWNGAGDSQQVTFQHDGVSCDAVDHGNVQIPVMGMQPLLGPTQWIHLCMQDQPGSCSNVMQIR